MSISACARTLGAETAGSQRQSTRSVTNVNIHIVSHDNGTTKH